MKARLMILKDMIDDMSDTGYRLDCMFLFLLYRALSGTLLPRSIVSLSPLIFIHIQLIAEVKVYKGKGLRTVGYQILRSNRERKMCAINS